MAKQKLSEETKADFLHYMKIVIAILIIAFVLLACYFGYRFGRVVFTDEPMTNSSANEILYSLTVTKGESVLSIGNDLEKHGVIESGLVFFVQSKVYGCKIDPGTYEVSSRKSSKAILKQLYAEYQKAREKK